MSFPTRNNAYVIKGGILKLEDVCRIKIDSDGMDLDLWDKQPRIKLNHSHNRSRSIDLSDCSTSQDTSNELFEEEKDVDTRELKNIIKSKTKNSLYSTFVRENLNIVNGGGDKQEEKDLTNKRQISPTIDTPSSKLRKITDMSSAPGTPELQPRRLQMGRERTNSLAVTNRKKAVRGRRRINSLTVDPSQRTIKTMWRGLVSSDDRDSAGLNIAATTDVKGSE